MNTETNPSEKHFFNSIGLISEPLEKAETKAVSQDQLVEKFFAAKAGRSYTPVEVHKALMYFGKIGKNTPLTSIRRAISTLTKAGKLTKLDQQRPGEFDKPNNTWIYNGSWKQGELDLLAELTN